MEIVRGRMPYAAVYLTAQGRWVYCVSTTLDGAWRHVPVGYCRTGCDGHRTKLEAEEHMREWLLDRATVVFAQEGPQLCKGRHRLRWLQGYLVWRGWTWMAPAATLLGYSAIGTRMWVPLCGRHRTKEVLRELLAQDPAEVLG